MAEENKDMPQEEPEKEQSANDSPTPDDTGQGEGAAPEAADTGQGTESAPDTGQPPDANEGEKTPPEGEKPEGDAPPDGAAGAENAAGAGVANAAGVAAGAAAAGAAASTLAHTPNGYVPGEEKKGLAEVARVLKERRLLRKDMKEKGITNRKDFNIIAESLGLALWQLHPLLTWMHFALGGVLAGMGLKLLLGTLAAGLATVFLVSTITEAKGSFTINLTGDMLDAGFVLSEGADFQDGKSRLFADALQEVNNITMDDIARDVDKHDGAHNGEHYFAYTFYIQNQSDKPSTYAWYFKLKDETLSVSNAVWIMLFEDGKQVIYTRPTEEGNAEELFGFEQPLPFADLAYDPAQYYERYEDGVAKYGIKTTPYANENIVAQGLIEDVQPNETHKYTVVLWVEGYDPECTDDIFGGFARFEMDFDYIPDDKKAGLFDGLFRTEYDEVEVKETDTAE